MRQPYNYGEAFSRNIGWLTEWEQAALQYKTVAIAGLGGVGGIYVQTLARLGIGGFHIADLDRFELANFNRQVGAKTSTIGQTKVEVLAREASDINPDLRVRTFPQGVTDDNIDDFLDGVDVFVDGFDFFELGIRAKVFQRCKELGIPAVTAAPVGMGTSYLVFMPDGMGFDEYFCLSGYPPEKQYVNFLLGVTPKGLHASYLVDPSRADLENKRAPSTIMGVTLCAGVIGAEVAKILLKRGRVRAAPWSHHFDAYLDRLARSYIPRGNRHPLQVLKRHIGYKRFRQIAAQPKSPPFSSPQSDVEKILDLARWAPSGDNAQPWRFRVEGEIVHIEIAVEEDNVYEFNAGQPTLTAAGGLLETVRIAASAHGYSATWRYQGRNDQKHIVDVDLRQDETVSPDPLIGAVLTRRTSRGAHSTRPLKQADKAQLAAAVGNGFSLLWWENAAERRRVAGISAIATDIRLRLEAAYKVHLATIDWQNRYSPDGIPSGALGLSRMTLRLMRPLMKSWRRMNFFNRFLGGTLMPRLEMDWLPGTRCAAHFAIVSRKDEPGIEDFLAAGAAMQRFWLTAERLGLSMQPNFAPICFSREDKEFADSRALERKRKTLRSAFQALVGGAPETVLAFGRIGYSSGTDGAGERSVRLPLNTLIAND